MNYLIIIIANVFIAKCIDFYFFLSQSTFICICLFIQLVPEPKEYVALVTSMLLDHRAFSVRISVLELGKLCVGMAIVCGACEFCVTSVLCGYRGSSYISGDRPCGECHGSRQKTNLRTHSLSLPLCTPFSLYFQQHHHFPSLPTNDSNSHRHSGPLTFTPADACTSIHNAPLSEALLSNQSRFL